MSRTVKRVPISFDWPMNKVWDGFLLTTCLDESCEDCRLFAKIKGLEMTSYDCPKSDAYDPPEGEGWQMWETTSEGSPISPVFDTPEKLATWLTENNASAFGGDTATYDQWLGTINAGYAPSAIIDNKGFRSGVASIGDNCS